MTSQAKPVSYRRIARSTIAMVVRCSLWLADDHLLSVKSTGYTEDYTRIYLKDLKGIVARRTRTWMVVNISLGSLLALFGLGILSSDNIFSAGAIASMIVASPLLVYLLINLMKGRTCKTSLLTPLGPVDIPALDRIRNVSRLIQQLRPLIATRQGSMLRSELLTRYEAERAGGPTATPPPVA